MVRHLTHFAGRTSTEPVPERSARGAIQETVQRFRKEAEAEFKSADSNGDGFLSPAEARSRFPMLAKEFRRVDRDGDGRISPQEFFQAKRLLLEHRLGKPSG